MHIFIFDKGFCLYSTLDMCKLSPQVEEPLPSFSTIQGPNSSQFTSEMDIKEHKTMKKTYKLIYQL